MKKIAISLGLIGVVAAVAVIGTVAYFTDTETSTGNIFTAGTIDIAVDGQNPWSREDPFELKDMKPSQIEYTNFTINNVGSNPVNVWKKVDGIITDGGKTSEPECLAQSGQWVQGQECSGGTEIKDLENVIQYDLSVVLINPTGEPKWNQTLYNMDKTISQITGYGTFLGMIPSGWSMKVTESYHMIDSAGNEYQGDSMTFNITLTAEQLKGIAVLEDKTGDPDWRVKGETAFKGTLTYGVKDSKFNFSFTGVAPLNNTGYSLIVYKEPFSDPSASGWPRSVIILASTNSDGSGNVNIPATSIELDRNLLNSKIWLVKTSDLNLTGNTMIGWNGSAYLFDTGLIDYYDADL